jgi:iron(III) transport system substrate-binding protein
MLLTALPRFSLRASASALGAWMAVAALLAGPVRAEEFPADLVAAAEKEGTATLYSSMPAGDTAALVKAFEKRFPKVRIESLRLTSGPLFSRYVGEVESGLHPADVFTTGSAALYQKSPDLFRRLTAAEIPNAAKLPAQVKAENDRYLNVVVAGFRASYNTAMIPKAEIEKRLRSWKDLADPYWRGKIVTVDPRASTIYMSWFWTMRKTFGDDWLRAVMANNPRIVDGGSTAAQQVAAGAFTVGFPVATAHIGPVQSKGAPIAAYIPAGPVVGIQSSLAVPKDAPHPNAGMLYARWMMTREAQETVCPTSGPTLPGPAINPNCPELSPEHIGAVDIIPDEEQKTILTIMGIKS